jgi:hypothetical protein
VARLHGGQGVGREVAQLERLVVVHAGLAPEGAAREGDADDHRLVAVAVAHPEVGPAVDPHDPLRHHLERGLLAHLAYQALRRLLARLHGPAGQAPLAVVAAELEQHVAGVVEDDRGHPRSQEEIVADLGP